MEEDIDIYADLPSFDLRPRNNTEKDQACNCVELKKELSSLTSELKNIHKANENLERNLASLLKTAKVEIARKDKMIDDLRKELDNIAFRRNNSSSQQSLLNFPAHRTSHQQHTVTEKHKDVAATAHPNENEFRACGTKMHEYEHKNSKPQNDIRMPVTVFGERLHKRIMEEEKEERRQKATSKLTTETKEIPEEGIVESDKENGSQSSINNASESNIAARNSNSEIPYSKNTGKRLNDDGTCSKNLKTENNADKTVEGSDDYNCIAMYDAKDDLAQYEVKDNLTKFEDRLGTMHSSKRERDPFDAKRRAVSEHEDTKQDRSCANGWRKKRSGPAKDYDGPYTRKGSTNNLRSSRSVSRSNERSNSEHDYYVGGYRKNGYRCSSPSFKSYSRSRSDYESPSGYHLREKSSGMYKNRKYNDHKYNGSYRKDRLRRDYDSKENDSNRRRFSSRERGDLRDGLRHPSSDIEDRGGRNILYSNNKHDSRKIKKATPDISNSGRSPRGDKIAAEIDFRASSSRTIVNTIASHNIEENTVQHNAKNASYNTSANSTSMNITAMNTINLEDGEILDSSEKRNNSASISEDKVMKVKIVPIEDEDGGTPASTFKDDRSILLQNDLISVTSLGETVDVSVTKAETASSTSQTNSKDSDRGEIPHFNSCKNDATIDELHNCSNDNSTRKSRFDGNLIDYTTQNVTTIEQIRDSNTEHDTCTDDINENLENSSTESATMIEGVNNFNSERATESKETDNSSTKNAVKIEETNNFNTDDDTRKTDGEELTATKVEIVLIRDIKDNIGKRRVSVESEICHQVPSKSNAEASSSCLSDHNYVRDAPIDISDLDAVRKPAVSSECKTMPETARPKGTKVEEAINVQSIGVKRTTSSTMRNRKERQSKMVIISRRRKAVTLSDNNASMTVTMSTNVSKASPVINSSVNSNNDSVLKPRACKMARVCKGGL